MMKEYWDNFLFIATALAFLFNEVRKYLAVRKKKRYHGLDKNLAIDGELYDIIWKILIKYKALRVYIVQFHNGSSYYTGQSIQRMTVSHEVVDPQSNPTRIKLYNDNILISEMDHRILTDIKKGDYYHVSDSDNLRTNIYNKAIAEWMDVYGVRSMYNFRIIDKKTQETVATLNIHFTQTNPLENLQVGELGQTKKLVEAIFDRL